MNKLKTQFGKATVADFQKRRWTFDMPKDFAITAGEFAIIPKDKYEALIKATQSISLSMRVHPDYSKDSEFSDMIRGVDQALDDIL